MKHPDAGSSDDPQGADQVGDDGGKAGYQGRDELNRGQGQDNRQGSDSERELE